MEAFASIDAVVAPFASPDIDTDQIFPSRFMQKPRKEGLGRYLFNDQRFSEDGAERPGFILNQSPYREARIIVAERNFGCGSSREQAVYALFDFGIRAVIAPSFGEIFFNNCFKSGLLPIRLAPASVATLLGLARNMPGIRLKVDLEAQDVSAPAGPRYRFEIDPLRKHCLLRGVDDIAFTLGYRERIDEFERAYDAKTNWL
jgi:3-isopropylmalate/(R)-2-methylmalate dehydratase small subunit